MVICGRCQAKLDGDGGDNALVLQRRFFDLVSFWPEIASRKGKAARLSRAWAGRHEEALRVLFLRTVVVILEWVLDQYKERKPRDPTIAAKFNTYKFADYKEQLIDLLRRVCTVSVETMEIIDMMHQKEKVDGHLQTPDLGTAFA